MYLGKWFDICTLSRNLVVKPLDQDEAEDLTNTKEYIEVSNFLHDFKWTLGEQSRTAALGLSYLDYVLKQFILAECTSNWQLRLQTTKDILNLFAATGHFNYAKWARFYVQQFMLFYGYSTMYIATR